ncbi:MAG: hypothetical protein AB7U20_07640 [Planctomycetaceae bacterium]
MNDNSHSNPEPECGEPDDLRIRECLARSPVEAVPSGIELRVLRKVKQRRFAERAVGTGVAAALLAAVGIGWQLHSPQSPEIAGQSTRGVQHRPSGGEPVGFGVNDADLAPMAASPPVASFALVGRNQLALLESLKSLVEE